MIWLPHRRKAFRSVVDYVWTANNSTLSPYNPYLKAYWPFEEESGNRYDLVGRYVAAIQESAGRQAGKYNYEPAWSDVTAGWFQVAHSQIDLAELLSTPPFTVSFHFKAEDEDNDRYFLASNDLGASGKGMGILYKKNSASPGGHKIGVTACDNNGRAVSTFYSASNWDDGDWHHLLLRAPLDPLGNWTTLYPYITTSPKVVADPADSAVPVLNFAADGAGIQKTFDSSYTDSLEFNFKSRVDTTRGHDLYVQDASNRISIYLGVSYGGGHDNTLHWYDGGSWNDIGTINADTWYSIRVYDINFTAHTYKVSLDGGAGSACTFANVAASEVKKITVDHNGVSQSWIKDFVLTSGVTTIFEDQLDDCWKLYIDNTFEALGGGPVGDTHQATNLGRRSNLAEAPLGTDNGMDELAFFDTSLSLDAGTALYNTDAGSYRVSRTPLDVWRLTVTTTGSSQDYSIDINAGTSPDIDVDWGDGTAMDTYTSTGVKTHTYTNAGTYTVKISGSFASGGNIRCGHDATTRPRLKATSAICYIPGLALFRETFLNCTGLTSIPADTFRYNPGVGATVNSFYGVLQGCTGITSVSADLFRYNTGAASSAFWSAFQGCTGLTSIPADLFRYNTAVAANGFRATFSGCTGLTSIPTDLFKYNTTNGDRKMMGAFYGCTGITSLPTDLFRYVGAGGVEFFYQTFYGCTGLTSLPTDIFRYNTAVSTGAFYETFRGCTALASLPTDVFRYNTAVSTSGFAYTFRGCAALASLPTDIFRYNTALTTYPFRQTFFGCTSLTSLPDDIFRYNTGVTEGAFYQTFYGCTGLTSLPTDIFRYDTAASVSGFFQTFYNCTGLTSLPTDVFRYNTAVSTNGFQGTFSGCTALASVPADIFRYNTAVSVDGFRSTFYECRKLQQHATIFFGSGEESTRFLNRVSDFEDCFEIIGAFTGTTGTAPALWDCDFGTETPTRTDCWKGHSVSTVSNYATIPDNWKGL